MTLMIDENKCARCGVCEAECPSDAVFQTEDSYVIDVAACNGCMRYGIQLCEDVCPNDAIKKIKPGLYERCIAFFK
jgi:MinD superfamily P-loop ATPase